MILTKEVLFIRKIKTDRKFLNFKIPEKKQKFL